MKDEIKEILDNKLYFDLEEEDYIKIKDYITNLQEELKSANESISWWSNRFKAVERDNRNYKSRNKKAIKKLETLMPICIMPNNTLIHGTEKAKIIEETLNILNGGSNE